MPAALKTPLPQPELAPDYSAAPIRDAAIAVSGTSARALRREEEVVPRPLRSRPMPRSAEAKAEIARARKVERHHRPFRLTITATLCGMALMGQLVMLLWLHGKTLTAAREVEKLDTQIAEVSNHIGRTQERIAAFDSSPQIQQWATSKGWRPATHLDVDDTTKVEAARAAAQAQADDQSKPAREDSTR